MAVTPRQRAIANASMEATRLARQMEVPYDRPVDVFLLAQRLRLWLAAQPLRDAYGFYLRQGDVAGIVVNSDHPESLQRFTCAHEIGHHILGHASHVDNASTLRQYAHIALQELQAQVFAASLLMPLPLVNRILADIKREHLSPADVYLFSREIGVSYSAAAWQLTQYHRLSSADAKALVKRGAAAAMTELRGMTWVSDARADVWMLGPHSNGTTIACRLGDELHLRLPEDLSTGWTWAVDEPAIELASSDRDNDAGIEWDGSLGLSVSETLNSESTQHSVDQRLDLVYDVHVGADDTPDQFPAEVFQLVEDLPATTSVGPDNDVAASQRAMPVLPGPGQRMLTLVPRNTGTYQVALSLRAAWDRTVPAAAVIRFTVNASERKRLPRAGYASPQKDLRAERLAAA
jgi:Zn-dependent peptidase ImmA (M78 family)